MRRAAEAWRISGDGLIPVLAVTAACFLLGGLVGCLLASHIGGGGQESLAAYVEGFLRAAQAGEITAPALASLVWDTVRWPLLALLLENEAAQGGLMLGEHVDELTAVAVMDLVVAAEGRVIPAEDLGAEGHVLAVDLEIEPDPASLVHHERGPEIHAPGADVDDGGGHAGLRHTGGVPGLVDGVEHDGHVQRDLHVLAALLLVELLQDLAPEGGQLAPRQGEGGGEPAPAGDAAQHGVVKYHPVKGVRLIGRSPGDDQQDLAGVSYADAGLADQGARFLDDIPFFALFKHRQIKSPIILRGRRASARYSFSLLYRKRRRLAMAF